VSAFSRGRFTTASTGAVQKRSISEGMSLWLLWRQYADWPRPNLLFKGFEDNLVSYEVICILLSLHDKCILMVYYCWILQF
jgi:hypothetical protein